MEKEERLVKVYSNNSKKSRLKRNKNKFQRIWNAEEQKYVKVRKNKYPVNATKVRKDWREIDDSKSLNRRHTTPKVRKPAAATQTEVKTTSVQKPEKKVTVHAKGIIKKAVTIHMYGKKLEWDTKKMQYREAA